MAERWPGIWDDPLVLWHGTTAESALSVLGALSTAYCFRDLDFGRGFYATTSQSQAVEWARHKQAQRGTGIGVVCFVLPRSALVGLHVVAFARGDRDADDYWRLVFCCRNGGGHGLDAAADHPYDLVIGPVARRFDAWSERDAFSDMDQWSFHTQAAFDALEGGRRCGWTWTTNRWTPLALPSGSA